MIIISLNFNLIITMYDFVIVLLPMVTTVNETIPVLTVLFTFNATDADGDPLTFTLTRSDSSNAESYFYVEQSVEGEGRIRVRQDLTLDRPQTVYRMTLRVSDGVNTASAPVTGMSYAPACLFSLTEST